MKKVIQESVDRVEEKLGSILEGYVSNLEKVFEVNIQEACLKASAPAGDKEDDDKDEDEVCPECEGKGSDCKCDDKEKVDENVIKNTGKEEVTYTKSKSPKKEKVSKFSKDGDATDGDSGYEDKKPSAETPDKKAGDNKEKDNETVPGKEGNSGKTVKEGFSEFKKENPKLDSTAFTKDKKGTESKEPGFDGKGDVGEDNNGEDVDHGATEELAKDSKLDDTNNAGFEEKPKPEGTALAAKKKAFPSKQPKVEGTPGTVKD
jgi:hypothetical protein